MFKFQSHAERIFREGEGEGAGGSGDKPDLNSPEIKAAIAAAVEVAIAPIKSKNQELLGEKKALQEKYSGMDDDEIKRFQNFQKQMENDEEARLIAEGKVTEVIDKRTERMRASLTSRIEEETNKAKEWEKKYGGVERVLHNTLIDAEVRDAATEAGIAPTAMSDVITRARQEFVFEDGNIISRDPITKEIKLGEDAKNPYSPKDWIKDLQGKAPHFWPGSTGGGFTGGFGSSENAVTEAQTALRKGGMSEYMAAKKRAAGK